MRLTNIAESLLWFYCTYVCACGGLGRKPKLCNVHCTVPFQACHARIFPAQQYSPRPILAAKNGPPGPPLVSQKWSSLANSGPGKTKFGNQNLFGDHFWQPKVVHRINCHEWSHFPILCFWQVFLLPSFWLLPVFLFIFILEVIKKWENLWIWLIVKQKVQEHGVK